MYEILRGMVGVLAPILSFTADEIYEAMPGDEGASVHLTRDPEARPRRRATRSPRGSACFRLRDAVLAVLEQRARREADRPIAGSGCQLLSRRRFAALDVDLAKLFIVSHVDLKPAAAAGAETESIDVEGIGRIGIAWTPARGQKCGRCWHYREEVATEGDLCARCQEVVDGLAPLETPTT